MAMMNGVQPAIRVRRAIWGPRRPSWSVELETVAEVMRRTANLSAVLPIRMQRKVISQRPPTPPVLETDMWRVNAGGVPAEWFSTPASDPERVFLYLHGGGYAIGCINSHRDLLARLCISSGMRVLAVDYRLAPEHPFPAQLDDARRVYQWLVREQGVDPARIVIGGESAGAGLTLSTLCALRDRDMALPAAAVLLSGWFDLSARSMSMQMNSPYDFVTQLGVRAMAKRYAPRAEHQNPLVSPIHADLSRLPPLLIQVGAAETLLDDSVRVADSARQAGTEVSLEVWPDMIHAWHLLAPIVEEGRRAISGIGEFAWAATSAGIARSA